MDIKELKIKELIAVRGHYFAMIMLISGGIASLLVMNLSITKMCSLMLAGLYFDFVFILKYSSADSRIKSILRGGK